MIIDQGMKQFIEYDIIRILQKAEKEGKVTKLTLKESAKECVKIVREVNDDLELGRDYSDTDTMFKELYKIVEDLHIKRVVDKHEADVAWMRY